MSRIISCVVSSYYAASHHKFTLVVALLLCSKQHTLLLNTKQFVLYTDILRLTLSKESYEDHVQLSMSNADHNAAVHQHELVRDERLSCSKKA